MADGATLDSEVFCHDNHAAALYLADAADYSVSGQRRIPRRVVAPGQCADLIEGVRIEQEVDALPCCETAAVVVSGHPGFAAHGFGLRLAPGQLIQQ